MRNLKPLKSTVDLSGAWCDGDAFASATLEAISFVTPALERFFIRTVAAALDARSGGALDEACRTFMREEAEHTSAHRKFNDALGRYLGKAPPGVAFVEKLLSVADRRVSLVGRIGLVAAMEHFAAVLSKGYLERQAAWRFECGYARDLFARHAQEEIAHRSVVFDLWRAWGGGGRLTRAFIVAVILLVGTVYLGITVPWILRHKRTGQLGAAIAVLVLGKRPRPSCCISFSELFRFTRGDFHPQRLVDEGPVKSSHR